MITKLNSHQIRASRPQKALIDRLSLKRQPIIFVLDNIVDTYNIGSFFRLADALSIQKIYLCGPVVTPPNIKIHRSSIGTWKWVDWEQVDRVGECLKKLKSKGYSIYTCEQAKNSQNYLKVDYHPPLALVFGSETNGASPESIKIADKIVEIPMFGINKSLNVLVSAAVIGYHLSSRLKTN
ncbi:MAG: TrmH family RNA methyltransferase [Candidatus Shapirobacteria bacterium]|jgi:tRNA G18 (ribose-2'-O)-methylase SpoU